MNVKSIVILHLKLFLRVNMGRTEKLTFLIDTGAEISIVRGSRLKPGINYEPAKSIDVKGISNTLLKTKETVLLKLFTATHETVHLFDIIGNDFDCRYDGILGQDFWKDKEATINYCNRVISMGDVVLDFHDKPHVTTDLTPLQTIRARTESIVRLPTEFKGFGIISKRELLPGVYLAEALTEGIDGYCVTSVVNALEEDITVEPLLLN